MKGVHLITLLLALYILALVTMIFFSMREPDPNFKRGYYEGFHEGVKVIGKTVEDAK